MAERQKLVHRPAEFFEDLVGDQIATRVAVHSPQSERGVQNTSMVFVKNRFRIRSARPMIQTTGALQSLSAGVEGIGTALVACGKLDAVILRGPTAIAIHVHKSRHLRLLIVFFDLILVRIGDASKARAQAELLAISTPASVFDPAKPVMINGNRFVPNAPKIGLFSREKYNQIVENIRARDRMREAMA